MSQQTLKNHIDKVFAVSGKQKCVKVWDGILPPYIFKCELPNIIVNFGITDAEIAIASEENAKVQERIKEKEKKQITKPDDWTIVQEIVAMCTIVYKVGMYNGEEQILRKFDTRPEVVIGHIMTTLDKYHKKCHPMEMKRWYCTVYRNGSPKSLHHMWSSIVDEFGHHNIFEV